MRKRTAKKIIRGFFACNYSLEQVATALVKICGGEGVGTGRYSVPRLLAAAKWDRAARREHRQWLARVRVGRVQRLRGAAQCTR